jgi:hypothetical protein
VKTVDIHSCLVVSKQGNKGFTVMAGKMEPPGGGSVRWDRLATAVRGGWCSEPLAIGWMTL